MKHASFAPSDADRWMECHSALYTYPKPEDFDNVYTVEGTNAHKLLETALLAGKDVTDYVGKEMFAPYEDLATAVTVEMADYVQSVQDYIYDRFHNLHPDEVPELFAETKVTINADCYGTADVTLYWRDANEIEIIDLKYGVGVLVDPDGHQLRLYALGAMKTRKLATPDKVTLTIAQPRGRHPIKIRSFPLTGPALRVYGKEVNKIVKFVKTKPEDSFSPSEEACQWCPGKLTCPARNAAVLENVPDMDEEMTEINKKVIWLATHAKQLREQIAEAERLLLVHVYEHGPAHGFKAVAGQSRRTWAEDEATVLATLRKEYKLLLGDITQQKLKGIPDLEKLVAKKKPKRVDEFHKELIFKPEAQPRLALADASGVAITQEALFADDTPPPFDFL